MRLLVVLSLAALGLLASASSSFASPPASLFGEQLNSDSFSSLVASPLNCDGTTPSTFSFVANGTATGPYPGTFEAQGTYTIGTHDFFGLSTLVTYQESFTIVSGGTTITGTESLASSGLGQCQTFFNGFGQHGLSVLGSGVMTYHATLRDASGSSSSNGLTGTTTHAERYDQFEPGEIPDTSFYVDSFNSTDADTVPPTLSVPGDMTVDATGPNGASVAFVATAADDRDPAPLVSCNPSSGSVLPVGDTTVTCTATDQGGNSTVATFVVHVRGAAEQAGRLAETVLATNAKQGIVDSLDAKLVAVQAALTAANAGNRADASNKLNAFINDVAAQSGKALTADEAAQLINTAKQIRAVLG